MRKKIGTVVDDRLYRRAKVEAAKQGRAVSDLLGEALERYLDAGRTGRGSANIADETFGSMRIDRKEFERILREEDGVLDA